MLKKHIKNLWENEKISFGEIKDILALTSDTKLENATQKFDGQQLSIMWSASSNELKTARNKSHVDAGGLSVKQLSEFFVGNSILQEGFTKPSVYLNECIQKLDNKSKKDIFEDHWFSVEVLYKNNPNIFHYDDNVIIFHEDNSNNLKRFSQVLKSFQSDSWIVSLPIKATAYGCDKNVLNIAFNRINEMLDKHNLNEANTIEEFYFLKFHNLLEELSLDSKTKNVLLSYIIKESRKDFSKILKGYSKGLIERVNKIAKQSVELKKQFIFPLELTICDFSCEALKDMYCPFIENKDNEKERLTKEFQDITSSIKLTGDLSTIKTLQSCSSKIKNTKNILSVEGIVFTYNKNQYKLNGHFGSINKIFWLQKKKTLAEQEIRKQIRKLM